VLDGLQLGLWDGTLHDTQGPWLRWFTATGELIPHARELADQEAQRADQEAQRADQEAQQRRAAEARIAELEATLRTLQTSSEG